MTLNSTFDNIDKTTITAGNTGYFRSDIFDSFVFGSAVLPCSVPTTQPTSMLFGTETSSRLNLTSFTASTGGADGYVIYINENNYFSAPVDGDEPTADRSWNGLGQQTVYVGSSASPNITLSNLDIGTQYFFQIYAYNDCSGLESYETTGLNSSDTTTPGVLTITGITGLNKEYNGTTSANTTGSPTLVGVLGGDIVTFGSDTAPVFTFVTANVGTGITVNTSGYTISGTDAGKYTLTQPTLSGDITAAPLTVTASSGQTKVYGATDPTLTYSISGFVNGDTATGLDTGVSISRAAGEVVGAYTITPSAVADSNYSVSFVTADFSITAASLTITGLTGSNKVYDGTTNATASETPVLSGVVSDDDVVLGGTPVFTFASAELGTDIQITTTGFIITGADSGNYTLTQPTLSADILTTLGVDDITDVKFSLKLYPNPAINYIRVLGLSEKANYIIYNLLGKKVGKGMVENDEDITIQNLSNGTYFIRIENAKAIKFKEVSS